MILKHMLSCSFICATRLIYVHVDLLKQFMYHSSLAFIVACTHWSQIYVYSRNVCLRRSYNSLWVSNFLMLKINFLVHLKMLTALKVPLKVYCYMCMGGVVHVEGRGQYGGIVSLSLPFHGFQVLNSGCQACAAITLPC